MRRSISCTAERRWQLALALLMTVALVIALAACSGSSAEEDTAASQTDAAEETEDTTEGGTAAEAEVFSNESAEDDTGMEEEDGDSTGQEGTEAETTTEPETTTRSEEEVGEKSLAEGTVVVNGYEVSLYLPLPDGWEAYDLDGETIYVSEDYPLSVPNISVYAAENDNSLTYTTKEIIEEVCEETFADMSFTMGEFENTTISGYDAVVYSYSIVTGETQITQYYVLVETELTLFRITLTDSGDACADVYEECIGGITIS